MAPPIRVLTAVPICDGHDSAINTINLEFIHRGVEVVYLGFHRYVSDIVRAAVQEDVAAVGISSYNGGHVEFFTDVVAQLRERGAGDIAEPTASSWERPDKDCAAGRDWDGRRVNAVARNDGGVLAGKVLWHGNGNAGLPGLERDR